MERISNELLDKNSIRLFVKRDDTLHPFISGNKWRKLKYNLLEARRIGAQTLLTFGGAYSNHIAAVAAAGQAFDFQTIGIIRGEPATALNPTLAFARRCDMALHYLDRTTYRQKHLPEVVGRLREKFGDFYLIPEGGTNQFALPGVRECALELLEQVPGFDFLCTACGTGGTLAGLCTGLDERRKVLGFSVLKGDFLRGEVGKIWASGGISPTSRFDILTDYHFGGYAKWKPELIAFINDFHAQTGIPLDPVYTG
ncbi:MAG: 1-aminocyclopropane-1-carboxylate deaminase/D-cysteine desulfhydrase, partial [Bacteroidetes bacterium]